MFSEYYRLFLCQNVGSSHLVSRRLVCLVTGLALVDFLHLCVKVCQKGLHLIPIINNSHPSVLFHIYISGLLSP